MTLEGAVKDVLADNRRVKYEAMTRPQQILQHVFFGKLKEARDERLERFFNATVELLQYENFTADEVKAMVQEAADKLAEPRNDIANY